MSYQVLARKWRPHDFESVVGQEPVVKAITHALRENRLHHAYLFTGTRGVGKTTLSRILAKSLNCVGPDGQGGVTDHPCGVCEACRAIDEGRFVDYIEMDAASNRSVEEMTALLEQAMYAPTNARYKVYMIDEVHQLTSHAFNAMLKTLEEPPEYVKFILATTDPQKVPVTVLSRCLQFNLRNVTPQIVANHMTTILGQEGIQAEPAALKLLGIGARGSMRDGLSLLDQAIAFAGGRPVTLEGVREMLGIMDSDVLVELLQSLAKGDAARMMEIAGEMSMKSLSFTEAMRDLAGLIHRVAMAQRVPEAIASDDLDRAAIFELAGIFTPEELQLYYQIALHGRSDMNLAPDEYAGFTMALLRMLAFKPAGTGNAKFPVRVSPVKTETSAVPKVEAPKPVVEAPMPEPTKVAPIAAPMAAPVVEPKVEVKPEPQYVAPWEDMPGDAPIAKPAMVAKPVPAPVAKPEPVAAPADEPPVWDDDDVPYVADGDEYIDEMFAADEGFVERFGNEEPVVEPTVEAEPEPEAPQFDDGETVPPFSQMGQFWYDKLRYTHPTTYARDILEHSECVSIEGSVITLRLEPFYENRTKNKQAMQLVQRIIDPLFGRRMTFKFEIATPQSRTISQHKRLLAREAKHAQYLEDRKGPRFEKIEDEAEMKVAFEAIKNSPEARILARRFGATVYRPSLKKKVN